MEENVLIAEPRVAAGSRAARRVRKSGRLPANVYGLGGENLSISLDAKHFAKLLGEGHRIVAVRIGDRLERGIVKEVQHDALGSDLVHVDIARIRQDQAVEVQVRIETVGTPRGVTAGGVLSFPMQDVTVSALPADVPERFVLNIEAIEIGQTIRLKDLTPPPKCKFVGEPETVVIGVQHRREEAAPAAAAAPEGAAPAQPEVIARKKEEEPEAPAK